MYIPSWRVLSQDEWCRQNQGVGGFGHMVVVLSSCKYGKSGLPFLWVSASSMALCEAEYSCPRTRKFSLFPRSALISSLFFLPSSFFSSHFKFFLLFTLFSPLFLLLSRLSIASAVLAWCSAVQTKPQVHCPSLGL